MNIHPYYKAGALALLFFTPIPMVGLTYNQKLACALTTAALSSYAGYTWLRTPETFTPTLTSINPVTLSPTTQYPAAPTSLLEDISDFMDRLPWVKKDKKREKAPITPVTLSDSKQCIRNATPTINLEKVPKKQPVIVFSPFCSKKTIKRKNKVYVTGAPGRGVYCASRYIANGAIPQQATCVTFDYRDARAGFNFGQEIDQASLKLVVDEVIRQQHQIILFGACRGAVNILNFITQQPTEYLTRTMKAVIVEAPPFSLKDVCKQHARCYVPYPLPTDTAASLLYSLYCTALPAYQDRESSIIENINAIPKDLPILIIHLRTDTYVSNENIKELLCTLVATGHTRVHVLILDDPQLTHATMSTAPAYARAIHAFLRHYNLPHDAPLADQGTHIQAPLLTPLPNVDAVDTLFNEHAVTANGWRAP